MKLKIEIEFSEKDEIALMYEIDLSIKSNTDLTSAAKDKIGQLICYLC